MQHGMKRRRRTFAKPAQACSVPEQAQAHSVFRLQIELDLAAAQGLFIIAEGKRLPRAPVVEIGLRVIEIDKEGTEARR